MFCTINIFLNNIRCVLTVKLTQSALQFPYQCVTLQQSLRFPSREIAVIHKIYAVIPTLGFMSSPTLHILHSLFHQWRGTNVQGADRSTSELISQTLLMPFKVGADDSRAHEYVIPSAQPDSATLPIMQRPPPPNCYCYLFISGCHDFQRATYFDICRRREDTGLSWSTKINNN